MHPLMTRVQAKLGRRIMKTGVRLMRFGAKHLRTTGEKRLNELWFSYEGVVERLLRENEIDLVLDVGANEGQFAQSMRNDVGYKGEIISFEPIPQVFRSLSAAAGDDPLWHVHNIALGQENIRKKIKISGQTVFSSFLDSNEYCRDRFGNTTGAVSEAEVIVCRLDDFLKEQSIDVKSRKIFLKMDTQGYDLEVFKGLGDECRRIVMLQSEVSIIPIYEGSPHWTESIGLYEKAGFGIAGLFPVNFDRGLIVEYDCVMLNVHLTA